MDTQHDIALTRALAEVPGPLPLSGVIHLAIPHTSRFTVVGNHLAQHPELSLTAIGIGVHIQSLPAGSQVSIKALAARFAEGETTIAAALRELETHGYLHRTRERLPNGRMITRTVFCNRPGALLRGGAVVPVTVAPVTVVTPVAPAPVLAPEPTPVPEEAHPPVRLPSRIAPKPPRRPLPLPRELTSELRRAASALLADLRRHAPELVLSEDDVEELVPGAAAWLERGAHPDAIRHALTTELPQPPKYPAKIVRHRLTALLPPPLPGSQELAPVRRTPVTPFQTCEGCDRAFRSPAPGHCRDCRAQYWEAA
ncbi:helix-turn-helix domain-containing protein [Streptomyces sp. NPDC045714]|uniref:helix-turn-helix domain-containing protein n=1 Tax=Streptomyces sp. NPDC045714 TaxID=3154913 RepID=UPI0033EDC559